MILKIIIQKWDASDLKVLVNRYDFRVSTAAAF